ncbi:TRADD-N-associated membrane domain-containing protein [Nocardia cerradoensis]|uniref:Cyanobacterial TRADD-N associated 2 transmembrane domain-containing protein n=1 Tax=Nocardia cerradoensis TaxID=85688 RepID=A0A231GSW8_9NOCA|nr:hypothetical protein [Nocardia cerradoensis]NKY47990.1 hypothetical protein [Nocardia cerradoensis]OXR39724.1 hypothetical protein B7C42_08203 [Nocardia cerradoensis]
MIMAVLVITASIAGITAVAVALLRSSRDQAQRDLVRAQYLQHVAESAAQSQPPPQPPAQVSVISEPTTADWALVVGLPVALFFTGLVIFGAVYWRTRRAEQKQVKALGAVHDAIAEIKDPNDLLGLMEVNRRQMDAYDAQARGQGGSSHWSSLVAMTVGLGIVGAGLTITVVASEDATKYAAAIVAAVGTATGGYIAQTFIRLNSAAQDQVRYYFEQPLVQSYLLTAERFVLQMPAAERPKQYQALVEAALKQAAMVPQHRVPTLGERPLKKPADKPARSSKAARSSKPRVGLTGAR